MSNRVLGLAGRVIVVLLVVGAVGPWEARGQGQRKEVVAKKAVRSEPTVVITARTSSIQSSKACPEGPRSAIPLPARSKMISREKEASRCRKSANAGFSHISARWLGHPKRKTRSSGPSPRTW